MITSLRLIDFKNFADATLRMGPFTVIVGTNASGKSNLRDAFRILHGIGRGYNLADIVGGKYGAGGHVEWNQIRGAFGEIVRFERPAFGLHVAMKVSAGSTSRPGAKRDAHYSITVGGDERSPRTFRTTSEKLHLPGEWEPIYRSDPPYPDPVRDQDDDEHLLLRMEKTGTQRKYGDRIAVRPDQPALTQIREHKRVVKFHKTATAEVIDVLGSMRFLDLSPEAMRQPAFPGQTILGDSGENLPAVLKDICADAGRRETLAEWTRELTPMDVSDFEFPTDPTTGKVQLAFKESTGRTVSAYVASDGTLRFLAMLAALLGANPAHRAQSETVARRRAAEGRAAQRRAGAGRVRGRPARGDAGARAAAGLRRAGAVLRADLSHPRAARPGSGRGRAPGGAQRQDGAAA